MTKRHKSYRSVTERSTDGSTVTKRPAGEETIRLLPTRWQSFLNECRILAMFGEDAPLIRVPAIAHIDTDVGVLMTEWIDGTPIGPKRPTSIDPADLARAIAVAQEIGRYWPTITTLWRLPITDHLRHHLDRGTLSGHDAVTIASALAVHPPRWHFAHGDLTARNLIKEPSGGFAVIDWERAGIHPAGYDLATLWYTTRDVPYARPTIEAAVIPKHLSSFLVSALLIALLHLDRTLDTGGASDGDPDHADADALVSQLGDLAMEGSARDPR